MRARRAAAWLLVRLGALMLIPVMVVLLVFIGAMALITEGPFMLVTTDWAAGWRRGRRAVHVAWAGWDGPTYTGAHGFGGRWGAPGPGAS